MFREPFFIYTWPDAMHQISDTKSSTDSRIDSEGSIKASVKDGMSNAVMLGAGETYLAPFAIFLQGSSFQIALLASLPLLIGALFQIPGVWLIENFSSRLKLIRFTASLQALIWLPLAFLPYMYGISPLSVSLLVGLAVLYQTLGSIALPAWNSLIGDLVPIEARGRFFGRRNALTGLITFISLTLAGQVLHYYEKKGEQVLGYAFIFLIAMSARFLSVYYLKGYSDPPYQTKKEQRFSLMQFLLNTPKSNFARFVFFFACMNFAAFIAGPFFGVYLLNDVKVSYFDYSLIVASVTIAQFLAMYYWGALTDQFGSKAVMSFCGVGVAIIPFFWLASANVWVIIIIQAFAGFFWAGFNIAGSNFMFDAVTPPKRARCVAYQSIINSSFIFGGSLLGSALAKSLSAYDFSQLGMNLPASVFPFIFIISGCIRLIVLLALLNVFKEVRLIGPVRRRDLIFRITSFRPLSGSGFGVVTAQAEKDRDISPKSRDDKTP